MNKQARIILVVLLTAGALLRLAAWSRPLAVLDSLSIPDDAYLSLEIAKNIGQGLGPLHGPGRTNGFQPLYVFLAAPFYAFTSPDKIQELDFLDAAVKRAMLIPILFDLMTGLLLAVLLSRRFGWTAATFVGLLIWMLHPTVVYTALNGLETSIAVCMVLSSILLWERVREKPGEWKWPLLLGVSFGFGCLARIDHFFLGALVAVMALVARARGGFTTAETIRFFALTGAGFLAVYTPWLVYTAHHTGTIYPVSGRAVRHIAEGNANFDLNFTVRRWIVGLGLARVWDNSPELVFWSFPVVVLALLGLIRGEDRWNIRTHVASFSLLFLFCLALFLAYTLHVLAYWFFDRYLFALMLGFLVLICCGIDFALKELGESKRRIAIAIATPLVVLACLLHPRTIDLFFAPPDPNVGYRNAGLWARDFFPADLRVGSGQTGAIAYYRRGFEVVNLDGVVNDDAFAALQQRTIMDYVRAQKIDAVIGWPADIEFLKKNSTGFREEELRFMTVAEGFRSWGQPWLVYTVVYEEPAP